jgi:hypothetical protein
MTGIPSPDEVRDFLASSDAILRDDGRWIIDGWLYDGAHALMVAELCMLTGQERPSAIAATAVFLNMARRIAALENQVQESSQDATGVQDG